MRLALAAVTFAAISCTAAPAAQAALWRTSFYGEESGHFNADGSRFQPMGMTAAHRSLPFGTRLQACYRTCVVVIVRDRGPAAWTGRVLDLARGAARAIGLEAAGVANIDVEILGAVTIAQAPHRRHGHRRARRTPHIR